MNIDRVAIIAGVAFSAIAGTVFIAWVVSILANMSVADVAVEQDTQEVVYCSNKLYDQVVMCEMADGSHVFTDRMEGVNNEV